VLDTVVKCKLIKETFFELRTSRMIKTSYQICIRHDLVLPCVIDMRIQITAPNVTEQSLFDVLIIIRIVIKIQKRELSALEGPLGYSLAFRSFPRLRILDLEIFQWRYPPHLTSAYLSAYSRCSGISAMVVVNASVRVGR